VATPVTSTSQFGGGIKLCALNTVYEIAKVVILGTDLFHKWNTQNVRKLRPEISVNLRKWPKFSYVFREMENIRGFIQKLTDWSPGARTVNDTELCH